MQSVLPAVSPPARSARGWTRVPTAIAIMWPLILVHLGLFAIPFVAPTWRSLVIMLVVTRIAGLAVTIGLHRYFAHRSFKTSRGLQFVMAVLGCSALQRGTLWWVSHHRVHHRHSDTDEDVHSPLTRSFWHGHFGWLFETVYEKADPAVVRDLMKYPELVWLEKVWLLPAISRQRPATRSAAGPG